jgi:hypothetical protein
LFPKDLAKIFVDVMSFQPSMSLCSVVFREPRLCARVETPPSLKQQFERFIFSSIELLPSPLAMQSTAPGLLTYSNMRTVAVALQEQAHLSPRFSLIQGSQFQCNEQKDNDGPCDHLCTNHGRYCAIHARELSGHAIVTETLRRLCIWKHYGEAVKGSDDNVVDPVVWWDYVIYHRTNCYGPHEYADEDCLAKAYKHAKIKKDLMDECMTDSGGLDDDNINTLLEDMITEQDRSGVVALPALQVHRQVLDHTSSYGLFESICRHFWTSNSASVPEMCETCGACPNVIGCLEKGKCVPFSKDEHEHHSSGNGDKKSKKSKGGHGWTVFWLLSIAAMGGGGWYYYKQQQEQNGREGEISITTCNLGLRAKAHAHSHCMAMNESSCETIAHPYPHQKHT